MLNQQAQRPYTTLGAPYNYSIPSTMYGSSLTGPTLLQSFNPTLHTISSDKGKGKVQDADFEAAFAQAVASLTISDANSSARIVELETSSTAVEQVSEDVKTGTEHSESVLDFCIVLLRPLHFIRALRRLQESDGSPQGEELAKWESEFNQLMTAQREELEHDYGRAMQDAWESGIGDFTDKAHDNPNFDELGYPILSEYIFGKARFTVLYAYGH